MATTLKHENAELLDFIQSKAQATMVISLPG
jgi:hypothetical protein